MLANQRLAIDYYLGEATRLIDLERWEEVAWCFEIALRDPRFAELAEVRADFGRRLGALHGHLLAQAPDRQAARHVLERARSSMRAALKDQDLPSARALRLQLTELHCQGFERFADQRDLLTALVLIETLGTATSEAHVQQKLETLRQRLHNAKTRLHSPP